uniref:Uncharacterized protein n=1 Tax=Sphaerodactylus townsendi TaxID=933632 RepID=A0ACB8EYG4_9SAUR
MAGRRSPPRHPPGPIRARRSLSPPHLAHNPSPCSARRRRSQQGEAGCATAERESAALPEGWGERPPELRNGLSGVATEFGAGRNPPPRALLSRRTTAFTLPSLSSHVPQATFRGVFEPAVSVGPPGSSPPYGDVGAVHREGRLPRSTSWQLRLPANLAYASAPDETDRDGSLCLSLHCLHAALTDAVRDPPAALRFRDLTQTATPPGWPCKETPLDGTLEADPPSTSTLSAQSFRDRTDYTGPEPEEMQRWLKQGAGALDWEPVVKYKSAKPEGNRLTQSSSGQSKNSFKKLCQGASLSATPHLLGGLQGDTLIDIGSGPTIYQYLSACEYFREIVATDYTDQNREEMQRWLKKEPGAFDWSPVVKYVCELEGNRPAVKRLGQLGGEEWTQKEEKVRRAVKQVLKCDVTEPNPLAPLSLPPADCVLSTLCLEGACKDLPTFCSALKNISSLLRSGGHLVLLAILEETFYMVGQRRFSCLYLDQKSVEEAVKEAGFDIEWLEGIQYSSPQISHDAKGVCVLVARKH